MRTGRNTRILTLSGTAVFGYIADRASSRKFTLLSGFILNAGATALLCFLTNIWILLLSRTLQGFSASIVYTVGSAILVDTFGTKNLGEWMGYNILAVNIGITISPTIGGALYEQSGYLSAFILLFALIALDIVMRVLMVERKTAAEWKERDNGVDEESPKQYGSIGPVQENTPALHSDGINNVDEPSSSEIRDPSTTLAPSDNKNDNDQEADPSQSLITDNADAENQGRPTRTPRGRRQTPTFLILLSSFRILANLYGSFVAVALLVSFDSALPLFVKRTFNWGPTEGGLVFIAITLPILGAPLAGKFTDKYRSRWVPALGFILVGVLTGLLALVRHNNTQEKILFCALLFLNGMCHTSD